MKQRIYVRIILRGVVACYEKGRKCSGLPRSPSRRVVLVLLLKNAGGVLVFYGRTREYSHTGTQTSKTQFSSGNVLWQSENAFAYRYIC